MNLKQKQAIEKIFASKKISDDIDRAVIGDFLCGTGEGLREKS